MKALLTVIIVIIFSVPALAEDTEIRLKALEEAVKKQQAVLDNMVPERSAPGHGEKAAMSAPKISLVLDTAFYSSKFNDAELEARQLPGFNTAAFDKSNGFDAVAELFIFAPVDPYFRLHTTIPIGVDGAELEEAYFATTALPFGLGVKGGRFKSGFGLMNKMHPHEWAFADAPLVYSAFLGSEGLIENGASLVYEPGLPFHAELGIEALEGDNEVLFGSGARSGAHAYAAYMRAFFGITDTVTLRIGASGAKGDTLTESAAKGFELAGDSRLYAAELSLGWERSHEHGLIMEAEYFYRVQDGELTDTTLLTSSVLERRQDGFYAQAVYRLGRWAWAVRYDKLAVGKDEYLLDGISNDFGRAPRRISGALEIHPSDASRIRLQYGHDLSARDNRVNREFFLQFVMMIGEHGGHHKETH
ncbi:MAG: hypothetical protein OEV59_07190 [Deltaproteobacteria bacterium]|nr:hypothetical protein [Deltaproteobacteria bacterium]